MPTRLTGSGRATVRVLLISTYELGRQPFGLASPAARLAQEGATVTCLDLAVEPMTDAVAVDADLIAFYVPMHTASRLASGVARRVRELNGRAHICFYGLYASVNEAFFRDLGAGTIIGGEFEDGLSRLVRRLAMTPLDERRDLKQDGPVVSLGRQEFAVPDRGGLPPLAKYASLVVGPGDERVVGYTETTRGCKHLCRHCPIVPVYNGRFRAVPRDVVLEDISRQVAAGAEHVTFGDPDFFNGPGHTLPIVKALHDRFPNVTYDVTIKIEHLVKYSQHVPVLKQSGCLFVTSAVESIDERILERFAKHHSMADFVSVVNQFRRIGLELTPTFVTFTPWTTLKGYSDLLEAVANLGLIENVAPVQYAIRLLIPAGSELLELDDVPALVDAFDQEKLCYPWSHPDPAVDELYTRVREVVETASRRPRRAIFEAVWSLTRESLGTSGDCPSGSDYRQGAEARATVAYLNEPWYC